MKQKLSFALYLVAIILIVIAADLGKLPVHVFMRIPHYDWIAHLILYGLLYRLLENLLCGKRISLFRWSVEKSFLITVIFITFEEFSQLMFPSRTFSLMDIFMGLLGICLFRSGKRRRLRVKHCVKPVDSR